MTFLLAWLGSLAAQCLPVACLVSLVPRWRRNLFVTLPVAVALNLGCYGLLAGVAVRFFAPTVLRFGIVTLMSPLFAAALLLFVEAGLPRTHLRGKHLAWLLLVTLVANLDLVAIYGKQGWDFDPSGRLFPGATYFRPPLNDDTQRDLILVNALNRDGKSPFLPNRPLVYQIHWHSGTALLTPWADRLTNYPVISGAIVATACLLTFLFLWALCALRPSWSVLSVGGLGLSLLFLAHTDVYSPLLSLLLKGRLGLEADWSFDPLFFRSFSLKLVGLTSPQHAQFFCLLLPFLVSHSQRGRRRGKAVFEGVLLSLAILVSPVLAAFFFLPFLAFEAVRRLAPTFPIPLSALRWREALRFILERSGFVILGLLLFRGSFGFSPLSLFHRAGVPGPALFKVPPLSLAGLPFVWIAAGGLPGLLLSALLVRMIRRKTWARLWTGEAGLLVLGCLVFHYFVTGDEIRRHFAMVLSVLAPVFIVGALPRRRDIDLSRPAIVSLGALALLLHGHFIYCYVGKPSYQFVNAPWRDYYLMNEEVKRRFPGAPVLGAVNPVGLGLQYPPVLEVTNSLSIPIHALVHTQVTPSQFVLLRRVDFAKNTLPYAPSLGYRFVTWGPVEDFSWGLPGRARFLREENLIATVGKVRLYRLADSLEKTLAEEWKQLGPISPAEWHFHRGERFAEGRWYEEALVEYSRSLRERPDDPRVLERMGIMLGNIHNPRAAATRFNRAIELAPKWDEPHVRFAQLLYRGEQEDLAEEHYRKAIALGSHMTEPYNNLAVILLDRGKVEEALSVLRQGETLAPPAADLHFNLARAFRALGKFPDAEAQYRLVIAGRFNPEKKAEAHETWGDLLSGRDLAAALDHYRAAVKLAPGRPEGHLHLGYAYGLAGSAKSAEHELREVLSIAPETPFAAQAQALLEHPPSRSL